MIDTHIHFWKLDRGDYGWLKPAHGELYRDFLPHDLEPFLVKNKVSGVIAVQAAQTVEETEFLLKLAGEYPFIRGVVGWLDVTSDLFRDQYAQVRSDPHFLGIRINGAVVENGGDREYERLVRNLSVLTEDGYSLDLLIRPHEMPSVLNLLSEIPSLKAAINHVGLPLEKGKINDSWHDCMRKLADYPNTACKISGMITLVESGQPAGFKPYVASLLEYFGTKRLMFGTDWPVALQAGGYDQVVDFFREVLPSDLSPSSVEDICVNNAVTFYLTPANGGCVQLDRDKR